MSETGSGADTKGNAPGNETSGTWVRVTGALAGANWGSNFTPRLGSEVLVDFMEGDMDRPVVIAQLYNGSDLPPYSAGVDSGVNHAGVLSGIHSHNLEVGGYNQWVVDDAQAQLRMRLATSSAASQLNMGYLISQTANSAQRGNYRGTGFEIRTDAWGMLRGAEGVLLSTSARAAQGTSVISTQMDTLESVTQLGAAQTLGLVITVENIMNGTKKKKYGFEKKISSAILKLAILDGIQQKKSIKINQRVNYGIGIKKLIKREKLDNQTKTNGFTLECAMQNTSKINKLFCIVATQIVLLFSLQASATEANLNFFSYEGKQIKIAIKNNSLHFFYDGEKIFLGKKSEQIFSKLDSLAVIENRSFIFDSKEFFWSFIRVPSKNSNGAGFCGAGFEDYIYLFKFEKKVLTVVDTYQIQSCLDNFTADIDNINDLTLPDNKIFYDHKTPELCSNSTKLFRGY